MLLSLSCKLMLTFLHMPHSPHVCNHWCAPLPSTCLSYQPLLPCLHACLHVSVFVCADGFLLLADGGWASRPPRSCLRWRTVLRLHGAKHVDPAAPEGRVSLGVKDVAISPSYVTAAQPCKCKGPRLFEVQEGPTACA
jgi:hypothetical protein